MKPGKNCIWIGILLFIELLFKIIFNLKAYPLDVCYGPVRPQIAFLSIVHLNDYKEKIVK